ncbi:unnamed protein product [Ixodes pacificus]
MWRNCDLYENLSLHNAGDAGYTVQPWLMTPIRAP